MPGQNLDETQGNATTARAPRRQAPRYPVLEVRSSIGTRTQLSQQIISYSTFPYIGNETRFRLFAPCLLLLYPLLEFQDVSALPDLMQAWPRKPTSKIYDPIFAARS